MQRFLFSLVMCIPASLATEPPVPIPDLPSNIYDGLQCYGGIDSVTCDANADISDCSPDDCYMQAPLLVSIYLIFNQAYNLLIILIIKYGSSNLLFMALTIMEQSVLIEMSL